MDKAENVLRDTTKQMGCDDKTQDRLKPDRNEIRGIQRKLRRIASVAGLTEEEIRLYSNFVAAVKIDPLELLAIEDPVERIAHVERQKRRAQYTNLFVDDKKPDTRYVGINSEAYLRIERSQEELLIVMSAAKKIMAAFRALYREEQEHLRQLMKQLEERLNGEEGHDEDEDIKEAAREMLRTYSAAV